MFHQADVYYYRREKDYSLYICVVLYRFSECSKNKG